MSSIKSSNDDRDGVTDEDNGTTRRQKDSLNSEQSRTGADRPGRSGKIFPPNRVIRQGHFPKN